jgi:hypothetical protein
VADLKGKYPTSLQYIPWQRADQRILFSMVTQQAWCRVTLYNAGDGQARFDRAGIYGHIGVAQCAKTEINL